MGGLDEMSNSVAVLHEKCRGDGKDLEEKMCLREEVVRDGWEDCLPVN